MGKGTSSADKYEMVEPPADAEHRSSDDEALYLCNFFLVL